MKKVVLNVILLLSMTIFFIGCSSKALPESRVGSISSTYQGTINSVEMVQVQGDGAGTSLLGSILGGVIGHQFGSGSGNAWATMGGVILGGAAGQNANVVDAQKLGIVFDNGDSIVTVIKLDTNNPTHFKVGDRVTVFITRGKVTGVRYR